MPFLFGLMKKQYPVRRKAADGLEIPNCGGQTASAVLYYKILHGAGRGLIEIDKQKGKEI